MSEIKHQISQTQSLSQGVQQALHYLAMDAAEMSEELIREAEQNPALEVVPPKLIGRGGGPITDAVSNTASRSSPLDNLKSQIRLSQSRAEVKRTAIHLLYSLNHRGYLTQSLSEFAGEEGISTHLAQKALDLVQSLDPPGIGARDLAECLELQLKAMPDADSLCTGIVHYYLEDLAKGNLKAIASACGQSLKRVEDCVETIRGLNPSPCDLDDAQTRYISPEFSVEVSPDGKLQIRFFKDYYPTFRLSGDFTELSGELSVEEKKFLKKYVLSARKLLQAVELRQSTMEKLAELIVKQQYGFFAQSSPPEPFPANEAARLLGVHPSTVYRALCGKYLQYSGGTLPLIFFFQREISGHSTYAVKEKVRSFCKEHPEMPDILISEKLAEQGIQVARRTIAKYRNEMKLASSYFRGKK